MAYAVKEIFYTLQGEGANAGRAAVFLRFTGCNLWTGRTADRSRAVCRFCDTDFVGTDGPGGGHFIDPTSLANAVRSIWHPGSSTPAKEARPLVVCTGGEPLLQLDVPLIASLHSAGFEVAVETNGTRPLPTGELLDWVCVSPKAGADLVLKVGDELKLVYPQPQPGAEPERFLCHTFRHLFLQPLDDPNPTLRTRNIELAVRYCLEHPVWRLSLQTHKLVGIP